jgi:hypothetical protein
VSGATSRNRRVFSKGVAAVLVSASFGAAAAQPGVSDAEFAVRWDPDVSGPRSAQEVVKLLNLNAEDADTDTFTIRYFKAGAAVPARRAST